MQALGSLLQLAPCPFWRLEAAIAPGPRLPPEEAASQDEKGAQVNADSVEQDSDPSTDKRTLAKSESQVIISSSDFPHMSAACIALNAHSLVNKDCLCFSSTAVDAEHSTCVENAPRRYPNTNALCHLECIDAKLHSS